MGINEVLSKETKRRQETPGYQCNQLLGRFQETGTLQYLNEALGKAKQALESTPEDHMDRVI